MLFLNKILQKLILGNFTIKNRKFGKGNLYLTEHRLGTKKKINTVTCVILRVKRLLDSN